MCQRRNLHRAYCSLSSGFRHIVKQKPRELAEFFLCQCVLVRNECLLARALLDKIQPLTIKHWRRWTSSSWGGGPSNINHRELVCAMIKKRHTHDSQGEGGGRVGVWDGKRGRADESTRVGCYSLGVACLAAKKLQQL